MMDTSHEKLSSLIDDELDSQQSLRVLQKLRNDPELAEKYQRYQIIGELMKQNQAIKLSNDFASNIHERLRDEPTYLHRNSAPARQIQWQNAAMATAACLLAAVVWLVPASNNSMQMQNGLPLAQNNQTPERVNAKLNEYLQAHDNAMYTSETDNNRRRQVRVVHY